METSEIKQELEIETRNKHGIPVTSKYRYVKPEDFTFSQDKIGKKIARKIIPLIKEAQTVNKEEKEDSTEIEVDMEKLIPMLASLDNLEIDEVDVIALCYVNKKYEKFNEPDYEILKEELRNFPVSTIEELRVCIPDFFTIFMPRLADGILTSMGTMEQPPTDIEALPETE